MNNLCDRATGTKVKERVSSRAFFYDGPQCFVKGVFYLRFILHQKFFFIQKNLRLIRYTLGFRLHCNY